MPQKIQLYYLKHRNTRKKLPDVLEIDEVVRLLEAPDLSKKMAIEIAQF